MMTLTVEQLRDLDEYYKSYKRGASALEKLSHTRELEQLGFVTWVGTYLATQMYTITAEGIRYIEDTILTS